MSSSSRKNLGFLTHQQPAKPSETVKHNNLGRENKVERERKKKEKKRSPFQHLTRFPVCPNFFFYSYSLIVDHSRYTRAFSRKITNRKHSHTVQPYKLVFSPAFFFFSTFNSRARLMCGRTPPKAIVARMSVSSSSSPRIASCRWRGVIRLTFKSLAAFPASSRTSAVRYSRTAVT